MVLVAGIQFLHSVYFMLAEAQPFHCFPYIAYWTELLTLFSFIAYFDCSMMAFSRNWISSQVTQIQVVKIQYVFFADSLTSLEF